MKIYFYIFFFVLMSVSCISQTFEMYNGDTINKMDHYSCKQGKWRVTGKLKPGTCFKKEQLAEEGSYLNSRKIGLWIEYYCNGNIRNKINFIDGRPGGEATMYHENGVISETGTWKKNRWIGVHKEFDTLGLLIQEIECDSIGKKIRRLYWIAEEQKFMIDSAKNSNKHWSNGNYMIPAPLNGNQTIYNKYRQIIKDGIFKDNQLMDGRFYIYDDDRVLKRIAVYKDGKYVRDESRRKLKKIKNNVDEDGKIKKQKGL